MLAHEFLNITDEKTYDGQKKNVTLHIFGARNYLALMINVFLNVYYKKSCVYRRRNAFVIYFRDPISSFKIVQKIMHPRWNIHYKPFYSVCQCL